LPRSTLGVIMAVYILYVPEGIHGALDKPENERLPCCTGEIGRDAADYRADLLIGLQAASWFDVMDASASN
jgi:hypothetical protein